MLLLYRNNGHDIETLFENKSLTSILSDLEESWKQLVANKSYQKVPVESYTGKYETIWKGI